MKKNGKDYEVLSVDNLVKILDEKDVHFDRMLVREGFAINLDMKVPFANVSHFYDVIPPFQVTDLRLMKLLQGSARVEINFQEYAIQAGDIVMIREGSYLEILEVSDDAQGQALAFLSDKYTCNFQHSGPRSLLIHPQDTEVEAIDRQIYLIYTMASMEPYRAEVVEPMVVALFNHVYFLSDHHQQVSYLSSAEQLYGRFMEMLNNDACVKLPVMHYAEHLCVTPQYLSRVVSQVSGNTVSYWINKAVMMKAKIYLADAAKTVAEVAYLLGFTNTSFFCRFFKRETGQTPSAYRRTPVSNSTSFLLPAAAKFSASDSTDRL